MQANTSCDRVRGGSDANATEANVRWSPSKSIWIGSMSLAAVFLAIPYFSWGAFGVFAVLSAITLCVGHSVGMHRLLIHRSFRAPKWLEYFCVYLGTLVGMAGPLGMVRLHDLRDWAQRQSRCHDYFCHRTNFWRDAWWQLHCRIVLHRPPDFRLEGKIAESQFYWFLEKTWMLQQVPLALLLFAGGGLSWVVWGIAVRVAVCVTGHWLVGHFAHRHGEQDWIVEGASTQGYNVKFGALLSMGESWHNNHHAFPGSARLGLLPGQVDPGWWLIRTFEWMGLARDIATPGRLPLRPELRRVSQHIERDFAWP